MCSAKLSVIAKTALSPLIMGACHLQSPVRLSVLAAEAAITDCRLELATRHAQSKGRRTEVSVCCEIVGANRLRGA